MLEPTPLFKPYQFVQQLEFKNKDIHRSDLGIDYFGFKLAVLLNEQRLNMMLSLLNHLNNRFLNIHYALYKKMKFVIT